MPRATLCGSYPRKEELVKATWNKDKGLLSQKELDQVEEAARKEVVDLQLGHGFQPITDGLLLWQDAFRPLVSQCKGFQVGGVTRLFETNRFYRQPILTAPPRLDWKALSPFFPQAGTRSPPWKAILPSPYWFARATKDEHYGDEDKLGLAIASYVNDVAKRLVQEGCSQVLLNDALLFYEEKADFRRARTWITRAFDGVKAERVLCLPNGNAAGKLEQLSDLELDGIGLDLIETRVQDLPKKGLGRALIAEVVDSRESLLEDPKTVAALASAAAQRLKPTRVDLAPTWDLEFVPHEVAVKKLAILAKAAEVAA